MNGRKRRPGLERLETREAPVGFIQGPPAEPRQLSLNGTVEGRAQTTPGRQETIIRIAASGRITPTGHTSVTGKLKLVGDTEQGFLVLNSFNSNLTIAVTGSAQPGGVLSFQVTQGMGTLPNTTAQFVREDGAGTLTITIGPGSGRVPLTTVFQSFKA